MAVRYWFDSWDDATAIVADLAAVGIAAHIGAGATMYGSGGEAVQYPVDVDAVTPGDWVRIQMARTELDEHDVGRSTLWDDE